MTRAKIIQFDEYRSKEATVKSAPRVGAQVWQCTSCGNQSFLIMESSRRLECADCGGLVKGYRAVNKEDL